MGHLHYEYFLCVRLGDRCVPELLRVIQVGTNLPRTGALRDVECRDQPAKTPLLQVSETLQNRNRASDAAADQDLPGFASGHTRRVDRNIFVYFIGSALVEGLGALWMSSRDETPALACPRAWGQDYIRDLAFGRLNYSNGGLV